MIASGFSWFHLIPAVDNDTLLADLGIHDHTYLYPTTWAVCFVLIAFGAVAGQQLKAAKARTDITQWYADEGLSVRNFFEIVIEGVRFFMDNLLSKADTRAYLPYIGATFVYIWTCNIISIIPGILPPTDVINTNVGMAIISLFVFLSVGLGRDPVGFLKHMWGPVLPLGLLLFPVEALSMFVIRPVALMLRLTGNMFGDHLVFNIMSDLTYVVIPVIFLILACVVSTIQAFVFSLLSVIYIYLAVPHTDHEEAHAH